MVRQQSIDANSYARARPLGAAAQVTDAPGTFDHEPVLSACCSCEAARRLVCAMVTPMRITLMVGGVAGPLGQRQE